MKKDWNEIFRKIRMEARADMTPEERHALAVRLNHIRKNTFLKMDVTIHYGKSNRSEVVKAYLANPIGYFEGTLHISFGQLNSIWSYYAKDLLIGVSYDHDTKWYPSALERCKKEPDGKFYLDAGNEIYIFRKDMTLFLQECLLVVDNKNLSHLLVYREDKKAS